MCKRPLDLFSMPPTQTSVDEGYWVITAITPVSMLEFAVSDSGPEYFDLASTYLKIIDSVQNRNNIPLADGAEVASVNNWMHALWSTV